MKKKLDIFYFVLGIAVLGIIILAWIGLFSIAGKNIYYEKGYKQGVKDTNMENADYKSGYDDGYSAGYKAANSQKSYYEDDEDDYYEDDSYYDKDYIWEW